MAARMAFAHFSVSSLTNFANSAGETAGNGIMSRIGRKIGEQAIASIMRPQS